MEDHYECVRVEKLRLKGGAGRPKRKRDKLISPSSDDDTTATTETTTNDVVRRASIDEGGERVDGDEPPVKLVRRYEDFLTPAERKYRAKMAQREKEQIKKLAAQSHRERVEAFNVKLEKEPSHFDIPKVGPG
jgi:hypothetical protein